MRARLWGEGENTRVRPRLTVDQTTRKRDKVCMIRWYYRVYQSAVVLWGFSKCPSLVFERRTCPTLNSADDLIQPWSATLRHTIIILNKYLYQMPSRHDDMLRTHIPAWVLQPWYWYWLKIVLSFILTVIADTSYHVATWVTAIRKSCC